MSHSPTSSAPCALVVDDDALIRMTSSDILEDAGFAVMEAATADAAITLLEQHHAGITLLFTDVHMPGTRDGFALARHTASHWPHIAIVIASGRAQPAPGDLPDGARFVGKPFSAEVVHHHLRHALSDEQKPEPLRT